MITKSITQPKPRPRAELDADTGKPDEHPLITCVAHVMGGHAHLKASKTTIEQVLRAELNRVEGPLAMSSGLVLSEEERRASFRFAIDILANLSKLYARLQPPEPPRRCPGRIIKPLREGK